MPLPAMMMRTPGSLGYTDFLPLLFYFGKRECSCGLCHLTSAPFACRRKGNLGGATTHFIACTKTNLPTVKELLWDYGVHPHGVGTPVKGMMSALGNLSIR
jgi:hypothetical protein